MTSGTDFWPESGPQASGNYLIKISSRRWWWGRRGGGGGIREFLGQTPLCLIILKIEAIASDARNCSFRKKPGVTIVKRSNLDHHVQYYNTDLEIHPKLRVAEKKY